MTRAKLRKWGDSLGVVVPKEVVNEQRLKEGDEILIDIKPARTMKDIFGSWKGLKIDAQQFKDERRKEDAKRDEILSRLIRNHRDD